MRSIIGKVLNIFAIDVSDPCLIRAQIDALSRQLPLMYGILLFSTWALSYTHIGLAPDWMTIYIPLCMSIIGVKRSLEWMKIRSEDLTQAQIVARLSAVNKLSVLLALFFTGWSVLMYEYGGPYHKAHVAFYMSITVISCIFCLMTVPLAAKIVTFFVNGAFVVFFISTNVTLFSAIALNVLLVCVGMLVIMDINYKNFSGMIKEQQRSQALIRENVILANVDSLTRLANRRAFYSELEQAFDNATQNQVCLSIGAIDLDGFKPVNDLYGHVVGDKLLQAVGERLLAACEDNPCHTPFRLGGDEFAIITTDAQGSDNAQALGNRICEALSAPFRLGEVTVEISGTIGFAFYPETGKTPQDLMERADYALYRGKRLQRGSCTLFTADLDTELHREARIVQTLKAANLAEEIHPVFQPIVDIGQHKAIAFEALARWTSPTLGNVSPNEFIPAAERAGLIGDITCIMFEKSLHAAAAWPKGMRLSFNLSALDLSSEKLMLSLISIIGRNSYHPHNIDFEVTETAFGGDFEQVYRMIEKLRQLGCGISLDDFGTGYSSLSRLHALPLTKIKIDRSFVSGIEKGKANFNIVKSLLALTRDMELECIVEGVETIDELNLLRTLGVDHVQGYYFSRPVEQAHINDAIWFNMPKAEAV